MSQKTVIGNADLIFGTLELVGVAFGQVTDGSIEHKGDEEGIPDSDGGFQTYLITNPGYTITFTAIFPATTPLPTLGAPVAVGKLGLTANVLNWKLGYSSKARKIDITCGNWLSMGSNPPVAVQQPVAGPAAEDS